MSLRMEVTFNAAVWEAYLRERANAAADRQGLLSRAVEDAGKWLRGALKESVQEHYTVTPGSYERNLRVRTRIAGTDAGVTFTSKRGTNMASFTVTPQGTYRNTSRPGSLRGEIIRGSGGTLRGHSGALAFAGYGGGENALILAREGAGRYPLEALHGPSAVSMTRRRFEDDVQDNAQDLLARKIGEALELMLR